MSQRLPVSRFVSLERFQEQVVQVMLAVLVSQVVAETRARVVSSILTWHGCATHVRCFCFRVARALHCRAVNIWVEWSGVGGTLLCCGVRDCRAVSVTARSSVCSLSRLFFAAWTK